MTRYKSVLPRALLACAFLLSFVGAQAGIATDNRSAKLARESCARGEELRREWNLDAAEAAFREATSLDPANVEAALGLARIARVKLDYARALRLLEKAALVTPTSAELMVELGELYAAAEEPRRARSYFESALLVSPTTTSASLGLAAADLLERDYGGAERIIRESLAREPQNSNARSMLARVLLETNKENEAAKEAEYAIALDAYNSEAIYVLACVRSSQHNAVEARSLARRIVTLDPHDFRARRMLSQYVDGKFGDDQRVSEAARAHYHRACALKKAGQTTQAGEELSSALRTEPRYYRALVARADIFLRLGDYERALDAAKLAAEIDPDGAVAHFELSCAYRGLHERARIAIGAADFATQFYAQANPAAYELTREVFPDYSSLNRKQQTVIDAAVAPLATYLPKLARRKARHYLLAFDERPSDLHGFADIAGERTADGRYYSSLRGVGGRVTVSGLEYLDQAASGGFNTIAHEFAHQCHIAALEKRELKVIHRLYESARRAGRTLDYYSAENEYEYFAQGYEAFISERKRPSAGVTGRHTRSELAKADPELYRFLLKLTGKPETSAAP